MDPPPSESLEASQTTTAYTGRSYRSRKRSRADCPQRPEPCADARMLRTTVIALMSDAAAAPQDAESVDEIADFLETDLLDVESSKGAMAAAAAAEEVRAAEPRGIVHPVALDVSAAPSARDASAVAPPGSAAQKGFLGRLPMELYAQVLKFLSPEDLSTAGAVCRVLRAATADEGLWKRLCWLRWGAPGMAERARQPRTTTWKKLYFQRDTTEMREFMANIPPDCPPDVRRIFVQFQAVKRSQAPCPDQLRDEEVCREPELAAQIAAWRRRQGVADVSTHVCSGQACSYHKIGEVFLCEHTGRAHVCDDGCREQVLDPENELLVCAITGRCFERWLSPEEEDEGEPGRLRVAEGAAADDQEPLMGAGRLGRAYCLGYECDDDRELRATQRALGFW